MNIFEQVCSDSHQMSLAEGGGPEGSPRSMSGMVQGTPMSHVWRGEWSQALGKGCTVRSNASWVMVTWELPCGQNDGQTHMKTLPYCKFVDGW